MSKIKQTVLSKLMKEIYFYIFSINHYFIFSFFMNDMNFNRLRGETKLILLLKLEILLTFPCEDDLIGTSYQSICSILTGIHCSLIHCYQKFTWRFVHDYVFWHTNSKFLINCKLTLKTHS